MQTRANVVGKISGSIRQPVGFHNNNMNLYPLYTFYDTKVRLLERSPAFLVDTYIGIIYIYISICIISAL